MNDSAKIKFDSPLRRVRKRWGLSLVTVAREVGTDVTHLSRIERGDAPRRELAERLAAFFNREITEEMIFYPERFQSRSVLDTERRERTAAADPDARREAGMNSHA